MEAKLEWHNDTKPKQQNADPYPPREWVLGLRPRRTHTTTPDTHNHVQPNSSPGKGATHRAKHWSVSPSGAGEWTLANQWPAACLRHTKVPAQLAWNLDRGAIKNMYQVPGTFFGNGNPQKKAGQVKTSRGELIWHCRWKRGNTGLYSTGRYNLLFEGWDRHRCVSQHWPFCPKYTNSEYPCPLPPKQLGSSTHLQDKPLRKQMVRMWLYWGSCVSVNVMYCELCQPLGLRGPGIMQIVVRGHLRYHFVKEMCSMSQVSHGLTWVPHCLSVR